MEINAAVVENDTVVNVIVIDDITMAKWIRSGMDLVDCAECGLAIGDVRRGGQWFRGDIPLPIPEPDPDVTPLLEQLRGLGVEV